MLTRIVQMDFAEEQLAEFLAHFEQHKEQIRSQEGCLGLRVLQDKEHPTRIFTYSLWRSEADLQNYRESEFFAAVWAKTKTLFAGKPRAWSCQELYNLD